MNKETEKLLNLINIQQKEIKVMENQILAGFIVNLALLVIIVLSLLKLFLWKVNIKNENKEFCRIKFREVWSMEKEEVKNDKTATKLKNYVIEHGEDMMKTLIELFEFQENIKFINTKIYNLNKKEST